MEKFESIFKDKTFPSNLLDSFIPFPFPKLIKKALFFQVLSKDVKILLVKDPFFEELHLANSLRKFVPDIRFFTPLTFTERRLKNSKFVCIFNLGSFSKEQLLLLYDFAKFNEVPILAFSNPKYGKIDPFIPLREQIPLISSILLTFDLIYPVIDKYQKEEEVVENLFDIIEGNLKTPIKDEKLRDFITFARKLKPSMTKEARESFREYYRYLRKYDAISQRQVMSWFKLMEASARLRLSKKIERIDVEETAKIFYVVDLYSPAKKLKLRHRRDADVLYG